MNEVLGEMKTDYPTDRDKALIKHFSERYRGQPAEQMGGVKETIANYLQFFLTPDVIEVFWRRQEQLSTSRKLIAAKLSAWRCRRNFRWNAAT